MKRAWHAARTGSVALGLIALALASSGLASRAEAFVLVTAEEHARELARGDGPPVRGDAKGDIGSPNIVLVRPSALDNVRSPTDIELRFAPQNPATIVTSTLRVLYGFFGIDVTDRLFKHATVSPSGILARGASLPEGSHRITIEIADSKERVGRRTFRFQITQAGNP